MRLVPSGRRDVHVNGEGGDAAVCDSSSCFLAAQLSKACSSLWLPRYRSAEAGFKQQVSGELRFVSSWLCTRGGSEDWWHCGVHGKNRAHDLCASQDPCSLRAAGVGNRNLPLLIVFIAGLIVIIVFLAKIELHQCLIFLGN